MEPGPTESGDLVVLVPLTVVPATPQGPHCGSVVIDAAPVVLRFGPVGVRTVPGAVRPALVQRVVRSVAVVAVDGDRRTRDVGGGTAVFGRRRWPGGRADGTKGEGEAGERPDDKLADLLGHE